MKPETPTVPIEWIVLAAWLWWVFSDRSSLLRQSHDLYKHIIETSDPNTNDTDNNDDNGDEGT